MYYVFTVVNLPNLVTKIFNILQGSVVTPTVLAGRTIYPPVQVCKFLTVYMCQ